MTPENFCYWLQGYFEISHTKTLNAMQIQVVQDHLNLIFDKVTPDRGTFLTKFGIIHNPDYNPPKEVGYCSCGGREAGYQYLNTGFTGFSGLPLC